MLNKTTCRKELMLLIKTRGRRAYVRAAIPTIIKWKTCQKCTSSPITTFTTPLKSFLLIINIVRWFFLMHLLLFSWFPSVTLASCCFEGGITWGCKHLSEKYTFQRFSNNLLLMVITRQDFLAMLFLFFNSGPAVISVRL